VPRDLREKSQLIETGYVPRSVLNDYIVACDAALVLMADTLAARARWPSKANQFLAAGRPIVMTRVGDLAQLLEEEEAALLVAPDADQIAEAVSRLLDDPARRAWLASKAMDIAHRRLAWPLIVDQLEPFYSLVRARAPRSSLDFVAAHERTS
jgi:glycosyltransferase involved in cell wall biosynthesis